MTIILWICFGVVMLVGYAVLLPLSLYLIYCAIDEWWPTMIRTSTDDANRAEIKRIHAALSRVGRVGCDSYSVEQLCWFCQQHGIELRNTKHGRRYTQETQNDPTT